MLMFVDFAIIMFLMLLGLVVFDIITGWVKGVLVEGGVSSYKNFNGYLRKFLIITLPILAFGIDFVVQQGLVVLGKDSFIMFGFDVAGVPLVTLMLLLWFSLGEVLSIIENLAKCGVPMPAFLGRFIKQVHDKINDGEDPRRITIKKVDNEDER